MKKTKKQNAEERFTWNKEDLEISQPQRPRCWESFFMCQPSPVLRSQLLTALMAGTVLEAECVPTSALLDVVLLATAAREHCNAEIVDDYEALLQRTRDEWNRPDWTTRVFDSIYANKANQILQGRTEFHSECEYVPRMVAWYLAHEAPELLEPIPATAKNAVKHVTKPTRKKAA